MRGDDVKPILFRGKAINRDPNREYRTSYKNGDWVYGLVSRLYDERFENLSAEMTNEDGVSGIDVDYRTIGEWTGFFDKNGNKVFDGDIICFGNNNYEIFWNDESYQWQIRTVSGDWSSVAWDGELESSAIGNVTLGWVAAELPILGQISTEVVGNKWDNPAMIHNQNYVG